MKKFSINKPNLIANVGNFLCGYFPDPTRFEPFLNFVVVNGIIKSYSLRAGSLDRQGRWSPFSSPEPPFLLVTWSTRQRHFKPKDEWLWGREWVEPQSPAGEAGEKNGARKSEPARELLIFEFPAFADECSDPIG